MEHNRKCSEKPTRLRSLIQDKEARLYNEEKIVSSITVVRKIG